ncbi:monooxygenase [Aspergillus heteromorphus CBS 117.55]|uniref:Monooxygenase n=1 Tax=Aspergillus heteromorphus CBS 117.55 TaxID=1448321 RepID=A0A317V621_9EURO|nr:monooxygenase [Aspergillus heteromorphus CBS 117.55]PWY69495.1 monooxygenase [Aspergillus heteromorphus CBS 117.55]
MSHTAPIAIIGGGPCGLTFARLLENVGIEYIIFERDVSPVPTPLFQGGTLDLHRNTGQETLRRAGLAEEFERLARRDATTMTVQDFLGNHRSTFGEGHDAPEIDRFQLRQLLLDSLPSQRIRWGKVLCTAERREKAKSPVRASDWVLRFADGSSESGFRLVVGADGAWSKLRQLIIPVKPQYSGKTFIEGRLSRDNPQYEAAREMVGTGNSMAIGDGCVLCIQQVSDLSYRVYMGIQAADTATRPGGDIDVSDIEKARSALLGPGRFYAGWAPHLRAFIEAAEGPLRPWPLHRLHPDIFLDKSPSWTRAPGVVLLGDAAHLSTPNGAGVNMAMYDALMLFESLTTELQTKGSDYGEEADVAALERAVIAYETEMRPRGRENILDSIMMEEMMYGEGGFQRMLDMVQGVNHAVKD